MTTAGRPAFSLIPGGLSLVPNAPATPTANAARSVPRIVAAAQQWAALMIQTGHADRLTLANDDLTELDHATLALLDSVDEYESHAAGLIPSEHQQGPAATLW